MVLEFNIFFLKEEHLQRENCGLDVPVEDWEIKKVGFVNIAYFTPRTDLPQYTLIGSGSEEFTCDENYESVKNKIEKACIFKFN